MKKNSGNEKKPKLSLADLKKKGKAHNESVETLSGGVLGAGAGASNTSTRSYDGDMPPSGWPS